MRLSLGLIYDITPNKYQNFQQFQKELVCRITAPVSSNDKDVSDCTVIAQSKDKFIIGLKVIANLGTIYKNGSPNPAPYHCISQLGETFIHLFYIFYIHS